MKTKKIGAVLSAMLMACSALPAMGFNAAAAEGKFPGKDAADPIRSIITNIHEIAPNKLNFDNDPKINFKDFKIVEKKINALYTDENGYYEKDGDTIVKYNSIPCNAETEKYDLNGDKALSPDDYCSFLYAISKQFKFIVSEGAGTGTQLTATITGIDVHREIDNLVIPSEIYDRETDRIYPVTEIAENAFADLKNLTKVEMSNYTQPYWVDEYGKRIPNYGESTASNPLVINSGAFSGCSKLATVVLPEYVSVCKDSFEDTPFFDKNHDDSNYDVKILKGSEGADNKSTVVAYGIRKVDCVGNLNIPACVTSISNDLVGNYTTLLENINFEKDSNGKYNIRFIGAGAFSDCPNLRTVNKKPFAQLDTELQNQLYKYVNVFNGTPFMAEETNRQLDKIVSKITGTPGYEQMNDAEKTLVAAKYFVYSVGYNKWGTSSTDFSLYPNVPYSTIDLARECHNADFAALNVRFTCCWGITKGFACVLDRIGVRNLTKGEPDHALNLVFIPGVDGSAGKWFTVDLSGPCGVRTDEIMLADKRDEYLSASKGYDERADIFKCDSAVVKDLTINAEYLKTFSPDDSATINIFNTDNRNETTLSSVDFFNLFSESAGNHVIGNEDFSFIFNNDNTKLLIYKAGDNDSPEYVRAQANAQKALRTYIDEGLIDFIDATDSANQYLDYDKYDITYMSDTKLYVVSRGFYTDAEHRFHFKNGDIVGPDFVPIENVTVKSNSNIKNVYFITDEDGYVTLAKGNSPLFRVRVETNGKKVYCYDLDSNKPLNGRFHYANAYYWLFENGELTNTDCID